MKRSISAKFLPACLLLVTMLSAISCRKEKALEPSLQDDNYYVNKDNPDDPVDHAIYQFYQSAGIASFYNDTIHRQKLRDIDGIPQYEYVTLSLAYTPFGNKDVKFKRLSDKGRVPALLELLKTQVLPQTPADLSIISFFLIDSFWNALSYRHLQSIPEDGQTVWTGFNTTAIKVMDMSVMNADEQKMYAASILAGLAMNRIQNKAADKLQKDFFSISRAVGNPLLTIGDIYSGLPVLALFGANAPLPKNLGFFKYYQADVIGIPVPAYYMCTPREEDDIRAFLTALFRFTSGELDSQYTDAPLVLKKLGVMRALAIDTGFKLPE